MPNLTDRYTKYSIYKMFVDSLKEDGVICDYYSKYYDENETFKGGTNSRRAFTEYNNKIIQYQNILKILNGEQRANIYEQIPAIDMFDLSNSGLMYTYDVTGSINEPVDATTIVSIESSRGKKALDLIEEEDKATLNRALMGEDMAEHFYNTTSLVSSDYNVQVSPWNGSFSYIYNGVLTPEVIVNGNPVVGMRKSSLLVYKVNSPIRVPFNPANAVPGIGRGSFKPIKGKTYYVDSRNSNTIVLNTDCGYSPRGGTATTPIAFQNSILIEKMDSDLNKYYLNLDDGDYLVAIPETTYSTDTNIILVFKCSFSKDSNVESIETKATSAWKNPRDGNFYVDKSYSKPIIPGASAYYLDELEKTEKGEYHYYRYRKEVQAYFECTDEVTPVGSSGDRISVKVSTSSYQSYILYISDFSSGLSSAADFEEVNPGEDIRVLIPQEDVISVLTDYVSIDQTFYANASGLLDGYYCEPCEWTEATTNASRTITKWKLCNDYIKAKTRGVGIDVGSKYFSGHLLERGDILVSPLKLTKSDNLVVGNDTYYAACSENTPTLESIGINGKATLLFKKMSGDVLTNLMRGCKVDDWANFKNYGLDSIITKYDYSRDSKTGLALENIVGGNSYNKVPMLYPNKFYVNEKLITFTQIVEYIDRFENCIVNGDTLIIDSYDPYTKVSHSQTNNSKASSNKEGSPYTVLNDIYKEQNITSLKTDFNTSFVASYNIHYKSDGQTIENRLESVQVSLITPRELFTRSYKNPNEAPDTILVFPEYNNYFPSEAILLSRYDLKLDTYVDTESSPSRGIVSFLKPGASGDDKVLIFKVDSKKALKFSGLKKIKLADEQDNHKFTDVEINTCCQEPGVYLCGRNDFTGAGKSDEREDKKSGDAAARARYQEFKDYRDCYIYFLLPMPIDLNKKVDLYDINDNPINLDDFGGSTTLLAASYPDKSYFPIKVTQSTEGSLFYEIENKFIQSSYETLKGSVIIPGLPKFKNLDELGRTTKSGNGYSYNLSAIANFLRGENINSIIGRVTNSVLFNWPLSTSTTNPLLIGNSYELMEGLVDFANIINDFSDSGFDILKNGEIIRVEKSELKGLLARITRKDSCWDRYYKFTQSPFDSIGNLSDDWPDRMVATMRERINWNDSTKKGIKTEILPTEEEMKNNTRPSLTEMAATMRSLILGSNAFSEENCKSLDNTFGNNTKAFLDIGDKISDPARVSFRNASISESIDKYYSLIENTLLYTINEYLGKKYEADKVRFRNELVADYQNLYTAESSDKSITMSRGNLSIKESKLSWNYNASITRSLLESIKRKGIDFIYKFLFFGFFRKSPDWNELSLDEWINRYLINPQSKDDKKSQTLILNKLSVMAEPYTQEYINNFNSKLALIGANVTLEDIKGYLKGNSDQWGSDDNIRAVPSSNNRYTFITGLPTVLLDDSGLVVTENNKVKLVPAGGKSLSYYLAYKENPEDMKDIWAWTRAERINDDPDVSADILRGMASYAKAALEGTPSGSGASVPYVKYVAGEDELVDGKPTGREDSLYFKRYQMLNNRMNRLKGPLWQAATYLRNGTVFDDVRNFSEQVLDSYDRFASVVPIESIEPMTYMPEQRAALSTVELPGKFYSDKELEAMRASINSKCVLTCTSCSIKDSCPFYDENEVVKMYCTGIETIDFWVKDNELDLLGDIKIAGPEGEGFSIKRYESLHKPYSDVLKKVKSDGEVIDTYEVNDLTKIRKQLSEAENLKYSDYVKDDMGWLMHARYGTVEKNSIKDILDENLSNDFYASRDKIHPYRYMYDALFIADEESYIKYTLSNRAYNVSFEMGKPGDKKLFTGTVKVKIPVSLKALDDADDEDDVYIISDDTKDADGFDIIPVIYLGKAKNIQWTFDLVDDGLGDNVNDSEIKGALSPDDPNIYAADVAQWCINYYKGNCADNPIGDISNGVPDNFTNRDQYWMENVYKKIYNPETGTYKWYQFPGRKRVSSGYSEPLIDVDNFDDTLAVSGRPMTADYVNFVRKVSIRIYNNDEPDETQRWTIPWVNPNLPVLGGYKLDAEKQRSVLPLMKTNLRLVVVKSGKD